MSTQMSGVIGARIREYASGPAETTRRYDIGSRTDSTANDEPGRRRRRTKAPAAAAAQVPNTETRATSTSVGVSSMPT